MPDRADRLRRRRPRRRPRPGDLGRRAGSAGARTLGGRAALPAAGRRRIAVGAPDRPGQADRSRLGRDQTDWADLVIVVGGEALVDLVEEHGLLSPIAGGGPFNTAIALGRLGIPVAYLGTLSHDEYGSLLGRRLLEAGVDMSLVRRSDAPTPLAVVHRQDGGGNTYTFYLSG